MREDFDMFVGDREQALAVLEHMGDLMCVYSGGDWPRRCDCKYGGPEQQGYSEKSGCPELASIYVIVSAMSDLEWRGLGQRGGNILLADAKEEVPTD